MGLIYEGDYMCNWHVTCIKLINNGWALEQVPKRLVELVSSQAEEGGIYGNPTSSHHQRHHHTEPVCSVLTFLF